MTVATEAGSQMVREVRNEVREVRKVSIREFAKRVAVSESAIRKAIRSGRLRKSVSAGKGKGHAWLVDVCLANEEWFTQRTRAPRFSAAVATSGDIMLRVGVDGVTVRAALTTKGARRLAIALMKATEASE